jgi:hypothetical protein
MTKELDDNNQFDTANDQGDCWTQEEQWSPASKGSEVGLANRASPKHKLPRKITKVSRPGGDQHVWD